MTLRLALALALLALPLGAVAEEAADNPQVGPDTPEAPEADLAATPPPWLPDLAALRAHGWRDVAWTTHRSVFRARKAGLTMVPWSKWPVEPRPGDRSLLVLDEEDARTALAFHEAKGLTRVEILVARPLDEVLRAVVDVLGPASATPDPRPLDFAATWPDAGVTLAETPDGASVVTVEAPESALARVALLPHEPWDREGPVSREVADARLAIGIPLLATSFVSALVLLPFATKNPEASLAVALPLGAGISIGSALTFSGAAKRRGALPKARLDAWEAATP